MLLTRLPFMRWFPLGLLTLAWSTAEVTVDVSVWVKRKHATWAGWRRYWIKVFSCGSAKNCIVLLDPTHAMFDNETEFDACWRKLPTTIASGWVKNDTEEVKSLTHESASKRAHAQTYLARRGAVEPGLPPGGSPPCSTRPRVSSGAGAPSPAASGGSPAAGASPGHAGARGATFDSGGRRAKKVDAREVAKQKAESALATAENSLSEAESSIRALRGRLRVADEACAVASARATCVFLRFFFLFIFLHQKKAAGTGGAVSVSRKRPANSWRVFPPHVY